MAQPPRTRSIEVAADNLNPSHIPDEVWERHRTEIFNLYIVKGRTLEQTREYMRQYHLFEAT
jgi:hypothetical protein